MSPPRRGRRRFIAALGASTLPGCAGPATPTESPTRRATATSPVSTPGRRFGYTHLRPDGNRVLAGQGTLPDGVPELAVVRTPHIGGTVEFYRRSGDELSVRARLPGYSTHAFGSRILDGGLAGDADGDGRIELVVPTGSRETLAGIRRTDGGATEAWRVPLGGALATNLAGVDGADGFAVGAGLRDGRIRVWT